MTKITIGTERFKTAVSKSIKGAGSNSLLAITEMMGIKLKDNTLKLLTTDGVNKLTVLLPKIEGDDFSITVNADLFSKLVTKTTSENITLEVNDKMLLVKANGDYKIPLEMDEEGSIDYPETKFNTVGKKADTVLLTTINSILFSNKASVAKTFETPCYTGYHIGETILTTNEELACLNEVTFAESCKEESLLMNPQMMNLLALNTSEKIKMYRKDKELHFVSPELIVTGQQLAGLEDYPVEGVMSFVTQEFESKCSIPKVLLLSLLDRLSLFIDAFDKNVIVLSFTKDGLVITSKSSNSVEKINYISSDNFKPFNCLFNVSSLKEQVTAYPSDTIEIHYGVENGIKMTAGNISQAIATSVEDSISEE